MERHSKSKLLLKLFFSTLYISSFTFGGGFVIITLMKRKFVDEQHWITEEEMLDITALAQSSPGAIAVNASILVGWQIAGALGMVVSILGTILPPLVILSVISVFYSSFSENQYVLMLLKGMQAGVAAVIFDVVASLGANVIKLRKPIYLVMMVLAFTLTFFFGVNVVYIIIGSAGVGLLLEVLRRRRGAAL